MGRCGVPVKEFLKQVLQASLKNYFPIPSAARIRQVGIKAGG